MLPCCVGLCGFQAVDVNMADMTDAFLACCIVASVAQGVTRIVGIGNQRVKECNRIAAMVAELGKCGVACVELEDGIEIHGKPVPDIVKGCSSAGPVSIHCYDDHRVAMSFAVLACIIPGIIITDKRCVEKTYPTFWDDLHAHFGMSISAAPLVTDVPDARPKALPDEGTVVGPVVLVLIGMRGVGKSSCGKFAANALGWLLVDIDATIASEEGCR